MSSIFQPRTEGFNESETVSGTSNAEELTKNKNYCVSRLPGLPNVFITTSFSTAYSDSESNYAVAISDGSIYVWCYKSIDSSPFAIQFPVDKQQFKLPMAILTRPASGTDQDPGLLMIDSITGLVKFYESVQHAPTLGLINDKSLELQLHLYPNECVTLVENVEPAGVAIATSQQRCILISLRDYKSKPQLSSIELANPRRGLFSKIFRHNEGDIVAIKSIKAESDDVLQTILILNSAGTIHSVKYYLLSSSTASYIDESSSFKQTLTMDPDAYPGRVSTTEFLDVWPMRDDKYFLALVRSSGALLLATFRADKSGALYFGSHNLHAAADNAATPRLFLPSPCKTAFVIVGNSVIMTDLDTTYIEPKDTFTYTKPRWEDVIRFNPEAKLIGYGYENQNTNTNPSIIVITENFGVLRVEKFPEMSKKETPYDPAQLVKSNIEQAIFFSDSKAISFDLKQDVDRSVVHRAVASIIKEILSSTSSYLPDTLPMTTDLTQLKLNAFKGLVVYCQRNFADDPQMIAGVVTNLEKANVALNLWEYLETNRPYLEVFERVVPEPRIFFKSEIGNISEVLASFLDQLSATGLSTSHLVLKTIYDGAYLNSVKYNQDIGKSWLFESDLLKNIESQFTQDFVMGNNSDKDAAYGIVEILDYFYINAIRFTKEKRIEGEYQEYSKLYNERKDGWTSALLRLGLVDEARVIAEKYHDFASLARVLDIESETTANENLNYGRYFEEYGYPFAASVYEYFIKNGKIQELLMRFSNYKHFLLQFFQENPKLTSNVSWIRYLIDEDFAQASKALALAESYNAESIDNQLTQLALGKLAARAAGAHTEERYDKELLKVRYQIKIRNAVAGDGRIAAITQANFVKQFINSGIDKSESGSLAANVFDALSSNHRLPESLLIELLTIIDPKFLNNEGFFYALNVAQTFSNKEFTHEFVDIILLRLLTLGTEFTLRVSGSDQVVKHQVESSILFKTLSRQPSVISQLNQLVETVESNGSLSHSVSNFNKGLLDELKKRLNNQSFKEWVHLVEQQVKTSLK
ncbi:NUP133 [Candida theae]|uniref:NUP133 n=1 Tax=Candida theae TaxID=1198502 RepID=A0AAD5FX50_9ASCO|nr:NUP133 [Candida theae]KAI5952978.1 NUP133 [Candida theae]